MKKSILFFLCLLLLIPGVSFAKRDKYKVVEVTNGGTIKGKVKSSEKVQDTTIQIKIKPKEDPKETELEKNACGDSQVGEMYILSPSNEVKNVFVIVEDIKAGLAAPKEDLVLDNLKCKFEPLAGIAYVKSKYVIKNSDPILHNTNLGKMLTGGKRRTVYNLALPFKDQVIKKDNRTSGLINVKCDAHPWMRAYIYSSKHPYAAITDASGSFEIKDIPPGKYTVRFWHEGFEDVVKEVEVKAGASSELNAKFSKTRQPGFMKGL